MHDADHVDIQAVEGVNFFGTSSYESVDALAIDTYYSVRAVVRDAEGERLIGASGFVWRVSDSDVVLVDGKAYSSQQEATLVPAAVGTTTLSVEVQGVRAEIPIGITGVPEPVDGGVPVMD